MLTNDKIINMIFPEGNAEEYIDEYMSNIDKYYFTVSNNPIKVNRDVLVINTKMLAIYSHLVGYCATINADAKDPKIASVLKRSIKTIAGFIDATKSISDDIMDEVSNDVIEELYNAANKELRKIYECVPNYIIDIFSIIVNT